MVASPCLRMGHLAVRLYFVVKVAGWTFLDGYLSFRCWNPSGFDQAISKQVVLRVGRSRDDNDNGEPEAELRDLEYEV